ncbi:MAG: hypothetical protein KGZ61_03985 [Sandarakinorhabdus sp.]|nr:hypothetical protein [Sandarakinorhabdus sp.]
MPDSRTALARDPVLAGRRKVSPKERCQPEVEHQEEGLHRQNDGNRAKHDRAKRHVVKRQEKQIRDKAAKSAGKQYQNVG